MRPQSKVLILPTNLLPPSSRAVSAIIVYCLMNASIRKAVEEMTKPKTLDEMLEEYDAEMASD